MTFISHDFSTLTPSDLKVSKKIRALTALHTVISDACEGLLDFKYHLCPIDAGMGKSTTLINVLRGRKAAGTLRRGGVIVFTQSIAEIKAFVSAITDPDRNGAALEKSDFAVFTSQDDDNTLGAPDIDTAPVLFTTHSMARSRLRQFKHFSEATCFHYQGGARLARIWDEAFQPARPLRISVDDLNAVPSFYRAHSQALVDEIGVLIEEVGRTQNNHFLRVPDNIGFLAQGVLSDENNGIEGKARDILDALLSAAGHRLKVIQKNNKERILSGCSKPLPDDIIRRR